MKNILLAFSFLCSISFADFVELKSVDEFNDFVKTSPVPVIVQFSAYWCQPCKDLKATFKEIAPDFTDEQVRLGYVDAYVNSSLQEFLKGGYPTVRVFDKGEIKEKYFTGSKPKSFVKSFIMEVIGGEDADFIFYKGGMASFVPGLYGWANIPSRTVHSFCSNGL